VTFQQVGDASEGMSALLQIGDQAKAVDMRTVVHGDAPSFGRWCQQPLGLVHAHGGGHRANLSSKFVNGEFASVA
jgi:hypothetical protein